MSHFIAVVIGKDFDHELAPFHEFECTGFDNEFIVDVDETENALEDLEIENPTRQVIIDHLGGYCGIKQVADGAEPSTYEKHKYGWFRMNGDKLGKVVRRTNPNAKWDWYKVGGRLDGYFLHKNGTRVDTILKSEIDFEGIHAEAKEEATELYNKVANAADGGTWKSWASFDAVKDMEERRKKYNSQPALIKVRKELHDFFMYDFDAHLAPKDEFVGNSILNNMTPFAVVKDRTWYQRGNMGWWGMVSDEKSTEDWSEKVFALYNNLPADTVLTAVDCHI